MARHLISDFIHLYGSFILPNGYLGESNLGIIFIFFIYASFPLLVCLPVYAERRRLGLGLRPIEFFLSYYLMAIWLVCNSLNIGTQGSLGNLVEPFFIIPAASSIFIYTNFFLESIKRGTRLSTIQILLIGTIFVVCERLMIPVYPE